MNNFFSKQDLKAIKNLYQSIIKCKKIVILIHETPDLDAICSALALQDYLIEKHIDARILGLENINNNLNKIFENVKIVSCNQTFLSKAKAIVLDTANKERILKRTLINEQLLCYRIDHHFKVQTICKNEWVNHKWSSTCEMIGWFLNINDPKKGLNQRRANFLYTGILTDTGKFLHSLTTPTVHILVSKFYDYSFDKQSVQEQIFTRSLKEIQFDSKLMKKIKLKNKFAYLILNKKDCKKLDELKQEYSKAYLMNNIKEIDIWMSAYYWENKWKISLRSNKYNVRKIANEYSGGGHNCASGMKLNNKKELKQFIKKMSTLNLKNYKLTSKDNQY